MSLNLHKSVRLLQLAAFSLSAILVPTGCGSSKGLLPDGAGGNTGGAANSAGTFGSGGNTGGAANSAGTFGNGGIAGSVGGSGGVAGSQGCPESLATWCSQNSTTGFCSNTGNPLTWNEALAAQISKRCSFARGFPYVTEGDCAGHHQINVASIDTGTLYVYDETTGALLAVEVWDLPTCTAGPSAGFVVPETCIPNMTDICSLNPDGSVPDGAARDGRSDI